MESLPCENEGKIHGSKCKNNESVAKGGSRQCTIASKAEQLMCEARGESYLDKGRRIMNFLSRADRDSHNHVLILLFDHLDQLPVTCT